MTDHRDSSGAADSPAPTPIWTAHVAELLAAPSPGEALARRDRLAALDQAALVRALVDVVGASAAPPAQRTQAAWLLKDLGDPGAAPALEAAYLTEPAGSELRLQILDTLERTAFGEPASLALDLPRLASATSERAERGHLIALLASIGSVEAQELLRRLAAGDAEARAQVVDELAAHPDPWVDPLLAAIAAAAGPGSAPEVDAAIAGRAHEELRARLRDPASQEPVGEPLLRELWNARDLALIADLAERGRLDGGATAFLLGLPAGAATAGLSKSQRKLLARACAALGSRR